MHPWPDRRFRIAHAVERGLAFADELLAFLDHLPPAS